MDQTTTKTKQNETKLNSLQDKLNKDKEEKFKLDRNVKNLEQQLERYKNEKNSFDSNLLPSFNRVQK